MTTAPDELIQSLRAMLDNPRPAERCPVIRVNTLVSRHIVRVYDGDRDITNQCRAVDWRNRRVEKLVRDAAGRVVVVDTPNKGWDAVWVWEDAKQLRIVWKGENGYPDDYVQPIEKTNV